MNKKLKKILKRLGLKVVKKLAQGGQGEVFIVQRGSELLALKLYTEASATQEQRDIISFLIKQGVPGAKFVERYAWPLEFVDIPDDPRFGYLMPLVDTSIYVSSENLPLTLTFGVRIEAARQLAECMRKLHIEGYCYKDISDRNYFLNPNTGDIILIDNDNVFVDQMSPGGVLGTGGFMAPEVVRGEARPSTVTDMHSLSALIFMLLCGNHPLHGKMENDIRIFDSLAVLHLYGTNPVFVFDPQNRKNALPNEDGYRQVAKNWKILPDYIKALFVQAFTDGLHHPGKRVTDIEWVHALSQILDMRHVCTCGAENFWNPSGKEKTCWNCQKKVSFPDKLYVCGKNNSAMLILPGQMLTTMHLGEKSSARILGEIEPHPKTSGACILRNKSGETWMAISGTQTLSVPPGKAIPLASEIEIQVAGAKLIVR